MEGFHCVTQLEDLHNNPAKKAEQDPVFFPLGPFFLYTNTPSRAVY